jgi:glucose/arabinose dehydrogenase
MSNVRPLTVRAGWTLPALLAAVIAQSAGASPATDRVLQNVHLPAGFSLEVYADNVPGARSMALGKNGTLFVGTRATSVYALSGKPGSGAKPTVRVIGSGLNMPNGVAFRDGALYVAEINRVLRYDDIEASLDKAEPKVVRSDLPRDRHHGWRYIAFGPDGKLYLPIGAPCNVCNQPKYGVITRMNADGSGQEVFARGVRNTVGFTWHPQTHELWFTENGRDYLGDNAPPCELNVAPRAGLDFGFPY